MLNGFNNLEQNGKMRGFFKHFIIFSTSLRNSMIIGNDCLIVIII